MFVDKHGNIWIGTNSNGIYLRSYENKTVKRIFYSGNDLENSINHIFLNDEGSAWISTISRKLFFISKDGKIKSGREIGSYGRNEFNSIVLDKNNYFWAATYDNGIYYFSTDSIYNIRAANGLKSDYCYSIICDDMNNIWVGHRKGFTKISADSLYLHAYGQEIGIIAECNLNSILLDQSGNILFGTNNGLIKYDYRDAQKSLSSPLNNLISVEFNDKEIDWHKKVVLPYNKYKLNIDFIGISFRNPDEVTYQYKLENYDLDWYKRSVISEATYPRIEDGKYTFKLRSFNSEGQMSEIPLSFKFVIKKPFWKTWWFILSVSGFLVFAMIAIIKIRERNHKRFQAFLEKELNERTKEVVEKKNEIEDKNREITHTLTQNVDSEGSQDGMDMIICEISNII